MKKTSLVALGLILLSSLGFAADGGKKLDTASQEALQKTLQLLRNPDLSSANPANQEVTKLAGKDDVAAQGIYELAADIFENLIKETDGDPQKALKILEEGKADPAGFARRLTPEQLAKLRTLSNRLPASKLKP